MTRAAYSLVTAFTSTPFGGNPAAVVFLSTELLCTEFLGKLANNLRQPILSVLSAEPLPSDDKGILIHSIRFIFDNGVEVPLCGHGTLAASKVIFSSAEAQERGVHTVLLKTATGATLKAVQCVDGSIEIDIFSADIKPASRDEKGRLKEYIDNAFGRNVLVKDIQVGNGTYAPYCLVELDVKEDLEGSAVDGTQLNGNGYLINVITTQSPIPDVLFVSRTFVPSILHSSGGEDHVCGSAHGLLVPYWYSKLGLSPESESKVKQVSSRGGELSVAWDQEKGRVRLRGYCVVLATGELHI